MGFLYIGASIAALLMGVSGIRDALRYGIPMAGAGGLLLLVASVAVLFEGVSTGAFRP